MKTNSENTNKEEFNRRVEEVRQALEKTKERIFQMNSHWWEPVNINPPLNDEEVGAVLKALSEWFVNNLFDVDVSRHIDETHSIKLRYR